jgi:hypothetical protein
MKKFLKNIVKLKTISTIKDFRFGTFPLNSTRNKQNIIERQTMKTMFVFKCRSSCGTVAVMVFLWPESYRFYSFVNALNYNIYLLNSSKVKQICINRNYYDLYVLNVKNTRFSNKNLVIKEMISSSGRTEYQNLTEMSRTGNLLLLISSLILRCFSKTFSFIVYFYILETLKIIIRCRNIFKKFRVWYYDVTMLNRRFYYTEMPHFFTLKFLPFHGHLCSKCTLSWDIKLEMSRTGNLLLLISSLILRCFLKTFSRS